MDKRVVVTGMGAVTPYGIGVDNLWKNLVKGVSKVRSLDQKLKLNKERYKPYGADLKDFDFKKNFKEHQKYQPYLDRSMEFIMVATQEACNQAKIFESQHLINKDRFSIYLGTTTGGHLSAFKSIKKMINTGERLDDKSLFTCTPSLWPMVVADYVKANGLMKTFAISCSAGGESVGNCFRDIRDGKFDIAITGGGDAPISQINYLSFYLIKATTRWKGDPTKSCRPYSGDRSGMVFGEGAGILVLESREHALKRGAPIIAEIVGYNANADGYHIVAPEPKAERYGNLITQLLNDSHVKPEEVGYVSCHGTGTRLNDKAETQAIKNAFNGNAKKIKIGSIKSMIGHAFGGSTAIEIVALIKSLNENTAPPTINYEKPDDACDLNCVPNYAQDIHTDYGLKIATGFGGSNNALLIKKNVL